MGTGIAFVLVADFAEISPIRQKMEQRTAAEPQAADSFALRREIRLRPNNLLVEPTLECGTPQ